MWIHHDPSRGSTRIYHVDPPGSITWIHQDPSYGSTRIHHVDPLGSITGFHQDPSCVSTRIHHVDPPGSIMWTHQDPSCGSTRIYQVDIPGSIMWNHHGVEGEAREIKLLLFETFSLPLFFHVRFLEELALLKNNTTIQNHPKKDDLKNEDNLK